jgi:two-component system sensor kinase FixL
VVRLEARHPDIRSRAADYNLEKLANLPPESEESIMFSGSGRKNLGKKENTVASHIPNGVPPFVVAVESARIPVIFVKNSAEIDSVIFANQSFLSLTGLTHADVLGRPIAAVLGELTDPATLTKIGKIMRAGPPAVWEMPCHRHNGSAFFVNVLATSVCSEKNEHLQTCLSFYLLDESFERLLNIPSEARAIYEKTPGFIAYGEGPEHRFSFANESYKKFVGCDKLEGLTVAEAMPDIAAQGFVAVLDRVFQTGEPYRGESVPFDLPDRESGQKVRRYADFIYHPIRNENRQIVGIFCEGYDVTERRMAEAKVEFLQAELRHSSRVNAMGTMAATLAHELNQPLSAIANYSAACLRLIDPADEKAALLLEAVRAINDTSQRAGNIIRGLRNLSSRRASSRVTFDLKTTLEESLNLVRSGMSPDITAKIDILDGLEIYADPVQIQQVVVNLLHNACDAVRDVPVKEISLEAVAAGREVEISVRDTGSGVSVEAAKHIFNWSETTKEGGMGLGLSICRTIVESHRGRIWLQETSSTGSAFHFTIPNSPMPLSDKRSGKIPKI